MSEIRIISPIAVLSDCENGWQKELNIVSVDNGPFVYDIREWRLDHIDSRDGISLSESEARALLSTLGECYSVNVGDLGAVQITMPIVNAMPPDNAQKPNVLNILKENGIAFIDKRERGGALWVIGGHELDDLMTELKNKGYQFVFSEKGGRVSKGQAAWYLTK